MHSFYFSAPTNSSRVERKGNTNPEDVFGGHHSGLELLQNSDDAGSRLTHGNGSAQSLDQDGDLLGIHSKSDGCRRLIEREVEGWSELELEVWKLGSSALEAREFESLNIWERGREEEVKRTEFL